MLFAKGIGIKGLALTVLMVLWVAVASAEIRLEWNAPSEGPEVTGYNVFRCELSADTGACNEWVQVNAEVLGPEVTTYEDDPNGTKFVYMVRAVGVDGMSTPSNAALYYIIQLPLSPRNLVIR